MQRFIIGIVSALVLAPLLVVGTVFALSEYRLRSALPPAPFAATVPNDAETRERGRHVARTRGCFGCHGQQLEGIVFSDWEWVERAVAPNLAAYAREHSISDFEAALRHGIGADGKALWSMPSYNFRRLSDADVVAIFAYLSGAEVVPKDLPTPSLGWSARWWLATSQEQHMAEWATWVPPLTIDPSVDPALARGEYLAMTTCNECHGMDLRGTTLPEGATPDLSIVSAYSPEAFKRLLDEGVALGDRELGLMGLVAPDRFAYFTDTERQELYAFLNTLIDQPVPPARWRDP